MTDENSQTESHGAPDASGGPPHVARLAEPCFLVICRDGANAPALRARHLDGHLRHVEDHWRSYITAGPIRAPGEDAICGSVFLVIAPSLEAAKALMNGDPYITCGLYETIEYTEFTNSVGRFIGGRIWESADAIRHRAAGGPTHTDA